MNRYKYKVQHFTEKRPGNDHGFIEFPEQMLEDYLNSMDTIEEEIVSITHGYQDSSQMNSSYSSYNRICELSILLVTKTRV